MSGPAASFSRRVLVLASGSSVAQIVPFLISPILTRIYSPSDFGVYAIFLAIVGVTSVLATGRYELAIVIANDRESATRVAALTIVLATAFSTCLLALSLLVLLVPSRIDWVDELGLWLLLVPICTLVMGISQALVYYAIHLHSYRSVAQASVYRSLAGAAVQVAIGLAVKSSAGLILGTLVSYVASSGRLWRPFRRNWATADIDRQTLAAAARRYSAFPRLSLPGAFANVAAYSLISMGVSALYSAATLGMYSLVQRVLSAPTQLVGAAIGQVFLRAGVDEVSSTGGLRRLYDRTLLRVALLSLPPFVGVLLFGDSVFGLVFGDQWTSAGTYAQALAPLSWIAFVAAPLSNTANVQERQGISMLWQFGLLVLSIACVISAWVFDLAPESFFWLMSAVLGPYYGFMVVLYRRLAGRKTL